MTDITEIKRRLHDRAQEVAEHLLPNGIRQGREWCVGSVQGERGESLKVCVQGSKAGVWTDFAAGGDGGDLVDLWCAVKGLALPQALDDMRGWLGLERPQFERREKTYRRPDKPRCTVPKSAVLTYLTGERLISPDAVRAFRIGEQGRTIVMPSFLPDGTLAAIKFLGVDRTPEGKKVTRVEAGCEPVLFGWQAVANANVRECTLAAAWIAATDHHLDHTAQPRPGDRAGASAVGTDSPSPAWPPVAHSRSVASLDRVSAWCGVPIRPRPPTGSGFARDKVAPLQTAVFAVVPAVVRWATAAG